MRDLAIAKGWVDQGLSGGFFYYMRARPIEWEQINWQLRLIDMPGILVDPHWQQAPWMGTGHLMFWCTMVVRAVPVSPLKLE